MATEELQEEQKVKFNESLLNTVADKLQVKAEDLRASLVSDTETKLEFPEGQFFTTDELSTLKTNFGDDKYREGKTAGSEMAIKDLKKLNGLEFEGKDSQSFSDSFKKKIIGENEAKPTAKIQDLTHTIDGLRSNLEKEGFKVTELQNKLVSQAFDNKITALIPNDTSISKNDIKTLFRAEHDVLEIDGQIVVKNGNGIMKDEKTMSPLTLEASLSNFITNKGLITEPQRVGRGVTSNGVTPAKTVYGITTQEDFYDYCTENRIDANSMEMVKVLREVQDANPSFKLE